MCISVCSHTPHPRGCLVSVTRAPDALRAVESGRWPWRRRALFFWTEFVRRDGHPPKSRPAYQTAIGVMCLTRDQNGRPTSDAGVVSLSPDTIASATARGVCLLASFGLENTVRQDLERGRCVFHNTLRPSSPNHSSHRVTSLGPDAHKRTR